MATNGKAKKKVGGMDCMRAFLLMKTPTGWQANENQEKSE